MDTNQEVRKAFLELGLYWAKHKEETENWNELQLNTPKDAQHNIRVYIDPGTIELELERKAAIFAASGIVGLVSDIAYIQSQAAELLHSF